MNPATAWCDEIDLDPVKRPVAMATRALGDRPWLVADENRGAELALKARLCRDRHAEVFAASPRAAEASEALAAAIEAEGVTLVEAGNLHPLDRAGRSVQEDLCLMERRPSGWYLAAASLCFPSRWRLADKIERHVAAIHGPVTGYDTIAPRVDQLFDRLQSPVWRRNWFVHGDPTLFQPVRPEREAVVPAEEIATGLVVRSERQVLRPVGPSGWLVFTIKTQQIHLGGFLATGERARAFARYLRETSAEVLEHRGLAPAQADQVRLALATNC